MVRENFSIILAVIILVLVAVEISIIRKKKKETNLKNAETEKFWNKWFLEQQIKLDRERENNEEDRTN